MIHAPSCPLCGLDDAVRCKDDPRFYEGGRLMAVCFHGHEGRGPAWFDAETGALVRQVPLQPFELLYKAASDDMVRGFGARFLAEHCGIYTLDRKAIEAVNPPFPTDKDWIKAEQQDGALVVVPLYRGAGMVGLEIRILERKDIGKVTRWMKTLGEGGIYIANPKIQPTAVVLLEGPWDAVAASWDAHEHQSSGRYAFVACSASTSAQVIDETLKIHFPGVPVVILTDQDGAGKSARKKFAHLGTLACLPGAGMAKDYREANPKVRWDALLDAVERSLAAPPPGEEHGSAKIARRALEGALKGKRQGMRDLEAWRYGQRCAGICRSFSGGKRYFSIRARMGGGMPTSEGQFEFSAILEHRLMKRIREDYPDLAAVIDGGATETPTSQQWLPPQFVEDGRHWTEIPEAQRKAYARERGWEIWMGKDPGPPQPDDLQRLIDQLRLGYRYVSIPEVPDSEVHQRVFVFSMAMALSALWAEERWFKGLPVGFLPWSWFYGGDTTGKGTASKLTAIMVSGNSRTYGSQRFDGSTSGWLTESVCYLPLCFRDELDEFLSHSDLEDLKTNLAGDPLQVRKKFEAAVTIAPKPVIFSTNSLKINEDDEATKSRVTVVNLKANSLSTREQRSGAFDGLYRWLEADGGQDLVYRVGIAFYRGFRLETVGKSTWTRSAVFDCAIRFVCKKIGINPDVVMAAANAVKESCIREGLPWYQALQDYVHHEMGSAQGYHEVRLVSALGIDTNNEGQTRKLRRWFGQLESALKAGPLRVGGWEATLGPQSPTTTRVLRFRSPSTENGHSGHPDTSYVCEETENTSFFETDFGFRG